MKWIRSSWTGVRCECHTKANLGTNGKTYVAMVSDSAKDGESPENHTHGAPVGVDRGY